MLLEGLDDINTVSFYEQEWAQCIHHIKTITVFLGEANALQDIVYISFLSNVFLETYLW